MSQIQWTDYGNIVIVQWLARTYLGKDVPGCNSRGDWTLLGLLGDP